MEAIILIGTGVAIGYLGREVIGRAVRKVRTGRAFGAVPAPNPAQPNAGEGFNGSA
jgi:hypothetical protein